MALSAGCAAFILGMVLCMFVCMNEREKKQVNHACGQKEVFAKHGNHSIVWPSGDMRVRQGVVGMQGMGKQVACFFWLASFGQLTVLRGPGLLNLMSEGFKLL